jgi:hypothetical protein
MNYGIHSAAYIIAHPLPVATYCFAILLKTGIKVGNRNKGLAADIKGGHKPVEKRAQFTVSRSFIVHGLNIPPFFGFGKGRKYLETAGKNYSPVPRGPSLSAAFPSDIQDEEWEAV